MNTLTLVQLPDQLSGPRHGGQRMQRRFKLYINHMLFERITEGDQRPFDYATGVYLDRALERYIESFERVLMCKCERVDHTAPEFKEAYRTDQQRSCEHDWRPVDGNWLVDRCALCGEERA